MGQHIDFVVLGASAGGVKPMARLLELLSEDLDSAFFVATHRLMPHALVEIFRDKCPLPVEMAEDATRIKRGKVYVCPADHNLWLEHGRVRVDRSPKESAYRPSINVLFRSAALNYGRRVAGVVLSGLAQDGAAGLWQIKERGGVAIVQDPREAEVPSMPRAAIENVHIDYVLPVDEIARKLVDLTKRRSDEPQLPIRVLIVEDEIIVANDMNQGLNRRGFQISGTVRSGEAAVNAVAAQCPDIVLMDIRLAGKLSGTDAARIIWERHQVPVIYLTAYSDDETLSEVKTSAGYGFVMKPFRAEAVEAAIKLALDRRERELRSSYRR
jgi:chemotaxis response regulator CheB